LKINTQTYEFNGKQVVFCVYDEAASGTEIFAVPVEVATRLNLEDYDGEEISRYEDFMEEIKEYRVRCLCFSNND
jgi:hypothetical protein